MDEFILGSEGVLSIYNDATSAYEPIACITSNSMSTELSVIETRTKCLPNVTVRKPGSLSYSLDVEGIYIDTTSAGSGSTAKASHDKLLAIQNTRENVIWRMGTGLTDNAFYYGEGVLTGLEADFDGSDDAFATFSATISGSGEVSTLDPTLG